MRVEFLLDQTGGHGSRAQHWVLDVPAITNIMVPPVIEGFLISVIGERKVGLTAVQERLRLVTATSLRVDVDVSARYMWPCSHRPTKPSVWSISHGVHLLVLFNFLDNNVLTPAFNRDELRLSYNTEFRSFVLGTVRR